jgi:hypothetical protein
MIRFIRTIIGLVLLAAAALFLLNGGWRQLGLGRVGVLLPSAGGDPRQQALANALARMGVQVLYATPDGQAVRLTLNWPGPDVGRGTTALTQLQRSRLIRSFQPASKEFLDQRYERGRPVFIGRYLVWF